MSDVKGSVSPPPDIDYEIDIEHGERQPSGDIKYGKITFYRDKSPNGLDPELHKDRSGPYLRLAVGATIIGRLDLGAHEASIDNRKVIIGPHVERVPDRRAEF